jgi:hypothetical protein
VTAVAVNPERARAPLARELCRIARAAIQSARELRDLGESTQASRCVQEARRMVRLARFHDRQEPR